MILYRVDGCVLGAGTTSADFRQNHISYRRELVSAHTPTWVEQSQHGDSLEAPAPCMEWRWQVNPTGATKDYIRLFGRNTQDGSSRQNGRNASHGMSVDRRSIKISFRPVFYQFGKLDLVRNRSQLCELSCCRTHAS